MASQRQPTDPSPPAGAADHDDAGPNAVFYGRHGSPEVTVAFPFSKVSVTRDDEQAQAGALMALKAASRLADLTAALAAATTKAERERCASELHELREELDGAIEAWERARST